MFANEVQLAFGNERERVPLCLNDDTTHSLIFDSLSLLAFASSAIFFRGVFVERAFIAHNYMIQLVNRTFFTHEL